MFDFKIPWLDDEELSSHEAPPLCAAPIDVAPASGYGELAPEAPLVHGYLPGGNAGAVKANGWPAPLPAAHGDDIYANLAARFKRVDKHGEGDAPNAITDAELFAMVHLYKNIDEGRGDLTIDTSELGAKDAQKVHDGYMENIARVMQSPTGRQMLAFLSNNQRTVDGKTVHRKTNLRAFHEDLDRDGIHDDVRGPLSEFNAEVVPMDPKGSTTQLDTETGVRSLGWGSDVNMYMNPMGLFRNGLRADVVLFHELVHALRDTTGTGDPMGVLKTDGVPQDATCHTARAEHQAVGIGVYNGQKYSENTYRADRSAIAEAGGPGVLKGDKGMERREVYNDELSCHMHD